MNKFTILLLIILSAFSAQAQLGVVQTKDAIHIYHQLDKSAFLSLPLNIPFIEASISEQMVRDKLGSFKIGEKRVNKVTNELQVTDVTLYNDDQIRISGELRGRNISTTFSLFIGGKNNKIEYSLSIDNKEINNIKLKLLSNSEEHIFGLGEQYSHVDMKGKLVPMLVEENGIGRGDRVVTGLANILGAGGNEFTTYAPIPFFLTTDNRAFSVTNTARMNFDFRNVELITMEIWDNTLNGSIFLGNGPKELLSLYTAETGRMPELPKWLYGSVIGLQGGKEKVDSIINLCLDNNVVLSAIWIQDWVGKRPTRIGSRLQWDWIVNETVYPKFTEWVDSLHRLDIRVLTYINPYLVEGGVLCNEALSKQYVVRDAKGNAYQFAAGGFNAYMIDFTNPAAKDWYKGIIKTNMLDLGVDGWMADFGEWVPMDATFHDPNINAAQYHNQYPVDWIALNREVLDENGRDDVFVFNRSGYSNSATSAGAFWVGDQMANFGTHDGLPSAICALNSSGMSGISINHSDVGGYTAIEFLGWKFLRERDLLYRWMEMAAFTPIYRTHEGLRPESMMQFYTDEETIQFFAYCSKLNKDLQPLFELYVKEAADFGWPVIRHPYLEFPEDLNTYHLKHQFMLGDSLMVIPVIEEQSEYTIGYLPEGEWKHYFTEEVLNGGMAYAFYAPYGLPAVFRREKTKASFVE